jgi:hypothetical protein
MADTNNEEFTRTKKLEELGKIHSVEKVYPRGLCENNDITFDAYIGTEKIPVTTVNNNKMESHFTFDKPKSE